MTPRINIILSWAAFLVLLNACNRPDPPNGEGKEKLRIRLEADGAYHVYPGLSIQAAIDKAANDSEHKIVKVHEGVYAPDNSGQAMVWFNRQHDGVKLMAVGDVTLTAENKQIAIVTSRSYPAVVNHVVYFGNGISSETTLDGFVITGANAHSEKRGVDLIDPNLPDDLQPGLFFFSDGGGIKIFGDSSPTLLNLKIIKNEVQVCGGGLSVEHRGKASSPVVIKNCIFQDNRCPATGSAIDLLESSSAVIENCLFVGNVGNYGMDEIGRRFGLTYNYKHGCGALTVFPKSTAIVRRCTFTANWSGVDDQGKDSRYEDCLFWMNDKSDGSREGDPFELDVGKSAIVRNCTIHGVIDDLQKTIDKAHNQLIDIDPKFDEAFVPQSEAYQGVGYRPAKD